MVQNAVLRLLADSRLCFKHRDRVEFGRRIDVPVVGPDDQAMVARILEKPWNIIIRLTRHEDPIRLEHIIRARSAIGLVAPRDFVTNPRHPLSRRFDKPPAQVVE